MLESFHLLNNKICLIMWISDNSFPVGKKGLIEDFPPLKYTSNEIPPRSADVSSHGNSRVVMLAKLLCRIQMKSLS